MAPTKFCHFVRLCTTIFAQDGVRVLSIGWRSSIGNMRVIVPSDDRGLGQQAEDRVGFNLQR